jgi:hypothetical protein
MIGRIGISPTSRKVCVSGGEAACQIVMSGGMM